jgi:hypothetical protein
LPTIAASAGYAQGGRGGRALESLVPAAAVAGYTTPLAQTARANLKEFLAERSLEEMYRTTRVCCKKVCPRTPTTKHSSDAFPGHLDASCIDGPGQPPRSDILIPMHASSRCDAGHYERPRKEAKRLCHVRALPCGGQTLRRSVELVTLPRSGRGAGFLFLPSAIFGAAELRSIVKAIHNASAAEPFSRMICKMKPSTLPPSRVCDLGPR